MTWLLFALHLLLIIGFGLRILLRDDVRPDVRMGWLTVIVLLPYVSCLLYYLFGEVALRRRGRAKYRRVQDFSEPGGDAVAATASGAAQVSPQWQAAFGYAASINRFAAQPGNTAQLMADGAQARASMLADMDAAQHEINLLYYIWLADQTGTATARALVRAARRGVVCRVMVDGLGSRALVHSPLWQEMALAGVQLAVTLPVSHPLRVMLTSRLDLRNHRKITLIDGSITYCGSQNCADEAFAVKARYAPWVDIMLRMQGPVVAQMQQVFASDWGQIRSRSRTPSHPVSTPWAAAQATQGRQDGFPAVVIAEGPAERPRSTSQLVSTLLASARQEVVISTPYFIPDATVLEALCAAAWRGVQVTLILPARNDSWIVGAASRSTYRYLLRAGVIVYEFRPVLLLAKTLCVDGQVALVGSTNLDLRSFDLNFENNVLLQDEALARAIGERQGEYIRQSDRITAAQVHAWPWGRRIWNNLLAMLSPVL
jgi:cardiolipin synthase